MRVLDRSLTQLRSINLTPRVNMHAEGSCLVSYGKTQVLCTATVEERTPPFLRNTGAGWITAEYGMLPRATETRVDRESVKGRQTGRSQEIQRLIGRALRTTVDLKALGERQIKIDCDVIQADGGTRTAAITGGFVALYNALLVLVERKLLKQVPIIQHVAAVSCGVVSGHVMLDLDYAEDSQAQTDANFILTDQETLIEVQATAEKKAFTEAQFFQMLKLAQLGVRELIVLQKRALDL